MNPISSAIRLTSSIGHLVNLVTKHVNYLLALQTRYIQTDPTIGLLIGQLSGLKTALNQICGWTIGRPANAFRNDPFLLDLKVSIVGCELVLSGLNDYISNLECDCCDLKSLSGERKARLLWTDNDPNQHLSLLENKTKAINRVFEALQW